MFTLFVCMRTMNFTTIVIYTTYFLLNIQIYNMYSKEQMFYVISTNFGHDIKTIKMSYCFDNVIRF